MAVSLSGRVREFGCSDAGIRLIGAVLWRKCFFSIVLRQKVEMGPPNGSGEANRLGKSEHAAEPEPRQGGGMGKQRAQYGEMAERSKATVLKTVRGASSSRVRILLSPPKS